ncbi:low temperature requirement protein A [Plantactinospora sp. CA-294935]|uniref:low temperature requirement protein A n=1 Tax=Plantactinospora sp. CA-294935 TaxID=3240012 RepID=UPI003D8A923C
MGCVDDDLDRVQDRRLPIVASNAYSLAHFFLIAGVIYSSLGMGQVIDHLAHHRTGRAAQQPLDWIVLVALYGGVAVYLAGRILFLRLAVRSVPRTQIVAVCAALLLLPSARFMPALAALGLLTAFLVTLVGYEWTRRTEQSPEVSDQQL